MNGMATPGELIKAVAKATGTSEPTVTQHDRNLFLAGLRTKGGRGTSAAKVTARDAAHLLTSILGSDQVKDSAETVQRYSDSVEHHNRMFKAHPKETPKGWTSIYGPVGLPALDSLPEDHSFIDALAVLIGLSMDETYDEIIGREPLSCQIIVGWPRTSARIYLSPDWRGEGKTPGGAQAIYQRYQYPGGRRAKPPKERDGPIERSAQIYATPIRYIGALLGDRLDKVSLSPKLAGTW
ncbi:hypothetical protein [Reyranella sp.]|uniref:hypothetical protein n=1 Tax=Reyranella sp. TaxID=1929291 RepID=UPI0027304793|nr:hypothetical protein [Reyranella sp.]MDP2376090.1 hypothetical protein [Reyranella sp.]